MEKKKRGYREKEKKGYPKSKKAEEMIKEHKLKNVCIWEGDPIRRFVPGINYQALIQIIQQAIHYIDIVQNIETSMLNYANNHNINFINIVNSTTIRDFGVVGEYLRGVYPIIRFELQYEMNNQIVRWPNEQWTVEELTANINQVFGQGGNLGIVNFIRMQFEPYPLIFMDVPNNLLSIPLQNDKLDMLQNANGPLLVYQQASGQAYSRIMSSFRDVLNYNIPIGAYSRRSYSLRKNEMPFKAQNIYWNQNFTNPIINNKDLFVCRFIEYPQINNWTVAQEVRRIRQHFRDGSHQFQDNEVDNAIAHWINLTAVPKRPIFIIQWRNIKRGSQLVDEITFWDLYIEPFLHALWNYIQAYLDTNQANASTNKVIIYMNVEYAIQMQHYTMDVNIPDEWSLETFLAELYIRININGYNITFESALEGGHIYPLIDNIEVTKSVIDDLYEDFRDEIKVIYENEIIEEILTRFRSQQGVKDANTYISIPIVGVRDFQIVTLNAFNYRLNIPGSETWHQMNTEYRGLKDLIVAYGHYKWHKTESYIGLPCLFEFYSNIMKISKNSKWKEYLWDQKLKKICDNGIVNDFLEYMEKEHNKNIGVYFPVSNYYYSIKEDAIDNMIIFRNHCMYIKKERILSTIKTRENLIRDNKLLKEGKYPKDYLKYSSYTLHSSGKIMTNIYFCDIETYTINENEEMKQIPWLIILLNYKTKESIGFWGKNCVQTFCLFIATLGTREEPVNIWSFNGAKFDWILLIDQLTIMYDLEICGTKTNLKMIKCSASNFNMYDMRLIYSRGTLKKLGEIFNLEHKKIDFDVTNKDMKYFEENKDNIMKYCINDCFVLLDLFNKTEDFIKGFVYQGKKPNFNISYTLPDIAMKLFTSLFLDKVLEGTRDIEILTYERMSYNGGICMNFKKEFNGPGKLYQYDINSSYPFVMTGFIPYGLGMLINYYNEPIKDEFLYEIELIYKDETIIPGMPVKTKNGLIYPLEVEKSWRWGNEINLALKYNKLKSFKIYRVIIYNDIYPIFEKYVNYIYDRRLEAKACGDEFHSEIYKLLMNSLYGKFGQGDFPDKYYCTWETLPEFTNNIKDLPKIKILNSSTVEVIFNNTRIGTRIGSLVRIASFITSKARTNILEYIYRIGEEKIYYMDTDCFISEIKDVPNIGKLLGQVKLERIINEAYFACPKMYYVNAEEEKIYKAKGVKIPEDAFKNGLPVSKIINSNTFKRGWGSISVISQEKIITSACKRRRWFYNNSFPLKNKTDFLINIKIK